MKKLKILHLPIKKQWFDMIAAGIKTEEYRGFTDFYVSRLVNGKNNYLGLHSLIIYGGKVDWKEYDVVEFRNGYGKDVPMIQMEFKGVEVRGGNPEWGAIEGEEYFVIKLGKIVKGMVWT